MFEPLKNFLIRNGLTQELVEEELYDYLMLGVLDKVASSLKNENTRNCALNLYRGSYDDVETTRRIAKLYCNIDLSEDECELLRKRIFAHFKKKEHRIKPLDDLRMQLWEKQNGCCAICKKSVLANNTHVDHIIPWDLVGDELEHNYQLLCTSCNLRKSNDTSFMFNNLFGNKYSVKQRG